MTDGFSLPDKRSDQVILEAYKDYWDKARFPRLQRIVFDNTLSQKAAVEHLKSEESRVDLVTELSPLETLRVAESPFATVVKNRGSLLTVFGLFNIRKPGSPWNDVRLRQALNLAINREDVIRYGAKGNGVIIPALIPRQDFGYDTTLSPYTFDPIRARDLLRQAGYSDGLSVVLIAPEDLQIQATVVSKMLGQVGLAVDLQIFDGATYGRKILLSHLDQPPEQQPWDIALVSWGDLLYFPPIQIYNFYALDGPFDWVNEQPELRQLYEQVLSTVEREQQEALIRMMERHTRDHAYFLFLYNPIQLYAVNKAVEFVPSANTVLHLDETSVTAQHWSVRSAAGKR